MIPPCGVPFRGNISSPFGNLIGALSIRRISFLPDTSNLTFAMTSSAVKRSMSLIVKPSVSGVLLPELLLMFLYASKIFSRLRTIDIKSVKIS